MVLSVSKSRVFLIQTGTCPKTKVLLADQQSSEGHQSLLLQLIQDEGALGQITTKS